MTAAESAGGGVDVVAIVTCVSSGATWRRSEKVAMAAAKKKSRCELARNLLDISASVKEAATGLLEEGNERVPSIDMCHKSL